MFSKPLMVAALVGGASAFDVVTVTHNKNLECGPCILGGYNFCTLKATMSYYSKLTAAYTRDQNTAVCCPVGKTECKNTADDTVVNNSALWTCYNLPSATTATNAYSFQAKSLELAACPFEETVCGATREFSYDTIGSTGTIAITKLTKGSVCSYLIKATKGAPNFVADATTTVTKDMAQIAWMEWDADEVTSWQAAPTAGATGFPTSTYPINTQIVSFHSTCTACKQGDLIKRSYEVTKDGATTTIDVTAKTISDGYTLQKTYYDSYTALCTAAQTFNDAITEPDFFSALFGAKKDEPLKVDALKASSITYTWENTKSQGGYGAPTAGYYSLATKGQKPYGAEGQGAAVNLNTAFDMKDQTRYMLLQVLPLNAYTQVTNAEVLKFTVGAYAWQTTEDFKAPTVPSTCVLKDGAATIKATFAVAAASLVALTLY